MGADNTYKAKKQQKKIDSIFESIVSFASSELRELDKRRRSTEGASPRGDPQSCNTSPDSGIGREIPAPLPAPPPPEPVASSPVKSPAHIPRLFKKADSELLRPIVEEGGSPLPPTLEHKVGEIISDEDELLECGPPRTPSPSNERPNSSVPHVGPHTPPYSPAALDGPFSPPTLGRKQPHSESWDAVIPKPNTPEPVISSKINSDRSNSPKPHTPGDEQYFKKKFYHGKDHWSGGSSWTEGKFASSQQLPPATGASGSQQPVKFRHKGKDWNWHPNHHNSRDHDSSQSSSSSSSYHSRSAPYPPSTSSSSSYYHSSSKHRSSYNRSHHHHHPSGKQRPRLLENAGHHSSYCVPRPEEVDTSVPPPTFSSSGGGGGGGYYHYQHRGKLSTSKWDQRGPQ
jgi:hypothetical protein